MKILYADDDYVSQQLIKTIIKKNFLAELTIAVNGIEAIDLIKKTYFDIILLDIRMHMCGNIVANHIRSLGICSVILAITAGGADAVKDYKENGFDDYILKPINKDDFVAFLNKYIVP